MPAACDPEAARLPDLVRLDRRLGEAFAAAARAVVRAAGVPASSVDLVGSHGQTVWHAPDGPDGGTLQLGQPAVIAEHTGPPPPRSTAETIAEAYARSVAPAIGRPDPVIVSGGGRLSQRVAVGHRRAPRRGVGRVLAGRRHRRQIFPPGAEANLTRLVPRKGLLQVE